MKPSLILIFSLLTQWWAHPVSANSSEQPYALPPREQIFDVIQRTTGLNAAPSTTEKIESIRLSKFRFPFPLKGQTGIRICLNAHKLNWNLRQLVVYLDKDATTLLAVTGRRSKESVGSLPQTPAIVLRGIDEPSSSDSFPAAAPKATLIEVLRKIQDQKAGSPSEVPEFDAFFVMLSRAKQAPRPVWIVEMSGLPPEPFSSRVRFNEDGEVVASPLLVGAYRRIYFDSDTGNEWFSSVGSEPR